MTTRIAFILALLIGGLVALDQYQGWGGGIFAARKGVDLIGMIAFWR